MFQKFYEKLCYSTTLAAAVECFSTRKEFFNKKTSGEIAFELISLFHVQINTRAYK